MSFKIFREGEINDLIKNDNNSNKIKHSCGLMKENTDF